MKKLMSLLFIGCFIESVFAAVLYDLDLGDNPYMVAYKKTDSVVIIDTYDKIAAMEQKYNSAAAREQSLANRMLGAAAIGAGGIGGMMLASGIAEQRADADAWSAQESETAQKVQTGGIVGGAGVVGGIDDFFYSAVVIDGDTRAHFCVDGFSELPLAVYNGNFGALFFMIVHHFRKIHVAHIVAVGHHHIFFGSVAQIIGDVGYCLETRRIELCGLAAEGRQKRKTAVFTRQIPAFAGAYMIHKRIKIVFCYYSYVYYARIDHVGQHKIYYAVSSAERYRRQRALCG